MKKLKTAEQEQKGTVIFCQDQSFFLPLAHTVASQV
jgi:hypothetical protein